MRNMKEFLNPSTDNSIIDQSDAFASPRSSPTCSSHSLGYTNLCPHINDYSCLDSWLSGPCDCILCYTQDGGLQQPIPHRDAASQYVDTSELSFESSMRPPGVWAASASTPLTDTISPELGFSLVQDYLWSEGFLTSPPRVTVHGDTDTDCDNTCLGHWSEPNVPKADETQAVYQSTVLLQAEPASLLDPGLGIADQMIQFTPSSQGSSANKGHGDRSPTALSSQLSPLEQSSAGTSPELPKFRTINDPQAIIEHLYIEQNYTLDQVVDILKQEYSEVPS